MHVRDVEMELYVLGRVSEVQSSQIAGHIAACPVCEQQQRETHASLNHLLVLGPGEKTLLSPPEKRKHQRIPTDDSAVLKIIYPMISEPLTSRILDVSKEGLRVRLSRYLEPGTAIEIRMQNTLVFAEVRYCIQSGESFEAGVHIQDTFPRTVLS